MARVEERMAYVEGQVSELSQGLADVRTAIQHLETRFDALDAKMSRQFEALDTKMSRQFVWLVGIVFTALVAMASAVLARG